jgi:Kelch motif/Galactose oxidase, central domain
MIRLKAHKSATIPTLASAGLIAIGLVVSTAIPARAAKSVGSDTFSPTRSMNTARMGHTATLLHTGQVLVVGGVSTFGGSPLTSAELFNPATGKWTVTGSTTVPHGAGTATLLPSGEVLLAGGTPDFYSCLATAELFNPATGKWTATGSMTAARCFHAAALLPNGQVLVAGGDVADTTCSNGICQSGDSLASAELYNPSTGTWQETGSLNVARTYAGAELLQNGKVLVAGGAGIANGTTTPLASAELFDASQGRWNFTGSPSSSASSPASLLANGDVIIVHSGFFNPATGTWTNTGPFPAKTGGGTTATLLGTGKVLVTGLISLYSGSASAPITEALLYDFSTNSYALTGYTGSMNTARSGDSATLLPNGQVLVAGGYNKETLCSGCSLSIIILANAELYTP